MIFQFDFARLERFQRESLRKILDVIQSENEDEIEVSVDQITCVDFSCDNFSRYSVRGDFGELFVCWDFEKLRFTVTMKEDAPCFLRDALCVQNVKTGIISLMSEVEFAAQELKSQPNRKRDRKRNRTHRIPVKAARFAQDGRLQR